MITVMFTEAEASLVATLLFLRWSEENASNEPRTAELDSAIDRLSKARFAVPEARAERAANAGAALARRFFAQRGKGRNVEAHLSEGELAALLAQAFERGRNGSEL